MNGRRKLTSLVVNIAYADAARMLNARAFLQVAEKVASETVTRSTARRIMSATLVDAG